MTFHSRFANEPMTDFTLGYAQTTCRQFDAAGPYHLDSNSSGWIQHDLILSPTLVLNLGLRLKVQRQPREKFSAWSMFEQDIGKVAITGANGDARNWQMSLKVIF